LNCIAMEQAGDYVFVIQGIAAQVQVYRKSDGVKVKVLCVGAEVAGWNGWIDIQNGINVYQRSNGEYLEMIEDDTVSRTSIIRWTPSAGGTAPSAQAAPSDSKERKPLRILPLGDSITRGSYLSKAVGLPHPDSGGWRKALQDKLRATGLTFDFVGELNYAAFGRDGVVDPNFDPDHQGLAGFSNARILTGGVVPTPPDVHTALGVKEITAHGIAEVLEKQQPDVSLLMSGANGFDAAARDKLIRTIGEKSTAHLFVATQVVPVGARPHPRNGRGRADALCRRSAGRR